MVEVLSREIQKIEKLGERKSPKTFRTYLQGCIQKADNDNNTDMSFLFREILKTFNSYYPQGIIKYEVIGAEMWQGKDSYEIYKGFSNDFLLREYRKDKETGIVTPGEPIEVAKENINYLLGLLKGLNIGEHYSARFFWEKIIKHYGLDKKGVNYLNFNGGGKMRATYYFPYYLYPLRVLESIQVVKLSGGKGGGVYKLK